MFDDGCAVVAAVAGGKVSSEPPMSAASTVLFNNNSTELELSEKVAAVFVEFIGSSFSLSAEAKVSSALSLQGIRWTVRSSDNDIIPLWTCRCIPNAISFRTDDTSSLIIRSNITRSFSSFLDMLCWLFTVTGGVWEL